MSELKKCPFCGSKAEVDFSFVGIDEVTVYYVNCLNCECGTKYHKTEDDAIETWNTRSKAEVALPSASDNKQSEQLLCGRESDCKNYGERCASCSRLYRDLYWTW